MTRLFNDPDAFADEVLEGFTAAHPDLVRRVPGGVVRTSPTPAGKVAVVIGGGSGHYPAFAGLVGPGLADGAALGNIFASPSAKQICSVARAASRGGGVLLSFGNYAGDVLHFGQAAEKLNRNGIPTKILAVTDDISSATTDEIEKRRGVAGDLAVFKVAAAAAEDGLSLEEVHRIASRANDRTRTLGVAFTGCTLPGAGKPLFTVPPGRMAVGMGIHGEPGTGEADVPTADELAEMLVTKLLDDLPNDIETVDGARAGLIFNGLGTVKHEELFVVYRRIAQLLDLPRRHDCPAGGRRIRHQLRHGRSVADVVLAGRRTRNILGRPRLFGGLPQGQHRRTGHRRHGARAVNPRGRRGRRKLG